jgi:hypothetical protein
VAGIVFGYEIESPLAPTYLRAGLGDPLVVAEADPGPEPRTDPVLEWRPRPDNPVQARLHGDPDRYGVWIDGMGGFGVEPDLPRITIPPTTETVRREERLWGVPAALCFSRRGDLPLHAAAVEIDGRALVFCGPGRFGKTTLATAFLRTGYRVLAEDLVCVRQRDGASAVLPGPASLRVRPDVAARLGPIEGTDVVLQDDDRVHLAMRDELRGSGDPVPLAGIVILKRGLPEITLYRVEPERFLPELFSVSFNLPTDVERARSFGGVVDLASSVPLWLLDRPLEFATLDEVVDRVTSTCLPSETGR